MKGGSQSLSCHAPRMVAIVGGSGAGKTFVAQWLQRALGKEALSLSLDDFYKDHSGWPLARRAQLNFDHPRAIDWKELARVLNALAGNQPVWAPRYNFSTHARLPQGQWLKPRPLILLEGLWLLHRPSLRRLFDLRIYLACPAPLRLRRRLARDTAERGRTAAAVRRQFFTTVAPMHCLYVAPQARWAHWVVNRIPDRKALGQMVKLITQL